MTMLNGLTLEKVVDICIGVTMNSSWLFRVRIMVLVSIFVAIAVIGLKQLNNMLNVLSIFLVSLIREAI